MVLLDHIPKKLSYLPYYLQNCPVNPKNDLTVAQKISRLLLDTYFTLILLYRL